MPISVCHLGKYYPPAPGGIEAHVQTLARAQARLGANVRVLCVNHANEHHRVSSSVHFVKSHTAHDTDQGVAITRLGRRAGLGGYDVCPGLVKALRQLPDSGVNVLHLHTPNPTMIIALARARVKLPLVITHHSDIIRQKILKKALRPFEHAVYKRAKFIWATNPRSLAASDVLNKYSKDVVSFLPLGIELDPFMNPSPDALAFAAELKQKHGQPLWLAVGRLVYYKGLHTAIAALKTAPGKLFVIGSGPLKEQLQQQAKDAGVADRIIWHGYATNDQLAGAYRAATAFWFPSNARSEAFGLVQVEAMASGCPIINTDIAGSGVPWVSRHNDTGLTVPIEDPAALAAAATQLATDPTLHERFSQAGPPRAQQEFSDTVMAQRTLDAYAKLIETP